MALLNSILDFTGRPVQRSGYGRNMISSCSSSIILENPKTIYFLGLAENGRSPAAILKGEMWGRLGKIYSLHDKFHRKDYSITL